MEKYAEMIYGHHNAPDAVKMFFFLKLTNFIYSQQIKIKNLKCCLWK